MKDGGADNIDSGEIPKLAEFDRSQRLPLHAQLREHLKSHILKNFNDGDKFTPEPALIRQLGVAQGTIRRALLDLAREGLLVRKVPLGTFVNKPEGGAPFVGVIVPYCNSPHIACLLDHISDECANRAMRLIVNHTHRGQRVHEMLASLNTKPLETKFLLLDNDPVASKELLRALCKQGFSVVTVDLPASNQFCSHVGVDNGVGVGLGIQHLMALGHRHICLLVNEPSNQNTRERIKAFHQISLTESGGLLRAINCHTHSGESSFDKAYGSMEKVWSGRGRPTAIFAVSHSGAHAALKWCSERGIKVPEDLSILCFDEVEENRYFHPPITAVAQPLAEIAREAMRLMDTPERIETILLRPTLIVRASTACPPFAGP
jgi:DNA-binding LacI/PurR family transcriptional regulator